LYETYLFEEILFNSLAGRALNCNTADESSIYQVKDKAWIHQRLSRTLRKFDAEAEIERSIIAYKVVGVASFIPEIQAFYPKTRVVIILRPPNDVFHSIVARQYFTNETLRRRNAAWPHRIVNGLRIPFLVKQSDEEFWLKSDEIHRAAYFYIRSYDGLEQIRNRVLVRYEEMVRNPEKFTRALAEILGMSWGSGTPSLIGQVKKMEKDRSQDYLKQLSGQMKEEVLRYATLAQEEACLTGVG
jgi:hypothetical protein